MATTKAGQRAVHKYVKNNYDRIEITVKKGKKTIISEYVKANGKTINGLVNELLDNEVPGLKDFE